MVRLHSKLARFALLIALVVVPACNNKVADGKADGKAIFEASCARCHGPKGIPSKGMVARLGVKPLNSERVALELSDEDIRRQVLKGSANKQMPSFSGALTDPQIAAIIAHVRSLRAKTPPQGQNQEPSPAP